MTLLLAATPSLGCKLPASARIPTTPYTAVVHSLLSLSPPEARTDTSSTEPAARRCPHYRPRLPTSDTKRALQVPRSCSAAFPYERRVLCRVLPAKVFTHVAVRRIECSVSNQCPGGSSKSSSSRKSSTAGSRASAQSKWGPPAIADCMEERSAARTTSSSASNFRCKT